MALQSEANEVAEFYEKYPELLLISLNRVLNNQNEHNVVAFQEPEERFVAICSFQCINEPTLELGYDVIKEMRGKGIGTQMAKAFFQLALYSPFYDMDSVRRDICTESLRPPVKKLGEPQSSNLYKSA